MFSQIYSPVNWTQEKDVAMLNCRIKWNDKYKPYKCSILSCSMQKWQKNSGNRDFNQVCTISDVWGRLVVFLGPEEKHVVWSRAGTVQYHQSPPVWSYYPVWWNLMWWNPMWWNPMWWTQVWNNWLHWSPEPWCHFEWIRSTSFIELSGGWGEEEESPEGGEETMDACLLLLFLFCASQTEGGILQR